MKRFLKAFREVRRGVPVREVFTVEWATAVQDMLKALADGENITPEGDLTRHSGDGRVRLGTRLSKRKGMGGGRFQLDFNPYSGKLHVGEGGVAWLPPPPVPGEEEEEEDPAPMIIPEIPTVGDAKAGDAEAYLALAEGVFYVVLWLVKGATMVEQLPESWTPSGDEDRPPPFVLGRVTVEGGEGDIMMRCKVDQLWGSDVEWEEVSESSSLYGGSGGPSGGPKTTAIVPTRHHASGYGAWFTVESPEVRFPDVLRVPLTGRVTRVPLDAWYLECVEEGTIWARAAAEGPWAVGARVEDGELVIETGWHLRPRVAVVEVTAIRRGFRGVRFPSRRDDQFWANEASIKSNYPE